MSKKFQSKALFPRLVRPLGLCHNFENDFYCKMLLMALEFMATPTSHLQAGSLWGKRKYQFNIVFEYRAEKTRKDRKRMYRKKIGNG